MEQEKIIDLIRECEKNNTLFTSFEIVPEPNLLIENFKIDNQDPLFFSIVWKLPPDINITPEEQSICDIPAVKLAKELIAQGKTVLLHVACIDLPIQTFKFMLDVLKNNSIKNLLVLRGDGVGRSNDPKYFSYVNEAIYFIKNHFDNYFCIGVVGFPNFHINNDSLSTDMKYLKLKVDVGANFIITQMCLYAHDLISFSNNCKKYDIEIPIIPGMCLLTSYKSFIEMTDLTKIKIPPKLKDDIVSHKDDNKFISTIMYSHLRDMIKELKNNYKLIGFHWFTLNHPKPIIKLCKELDLL